MAYNSTKVKERQVTSPSQQTQQLGIVSEVPMNEWSSAVSYEKLNLVTYKNSTFIAKRPNTGIAPLDADGWQDVWMPLLNGVNIFSATIEYALGDPNSNIPPQSGWSTDIPALDGVKHLWTRLTIVYTDGKQSVLYSVGSTISLDQLNDAVAKAQEAEKGAQTAQQGALDAKTAAETAQQGALTAKSEAQSAAEAAQTSAQNAQSSASAASQASASASAANTAAQTAATQSAQSAEAAKKAQEAAQSAVEDYYTKAETDSAIETAIENAITKVLNTPV